MTVSLKDTAFKLNKFRFLKNWPLTSCIWPQPAMTSSWPSPSRKEGFVSHKSWWPHCLALQVTPLSKGEPVLVFPGYGDYTPVPWSLERNQSQCEMWTNQEGSKKEDNSVVGVMVWIDKEDRTFSSISLVITGLYIDQVPPWSITL